MAFKDVLMTTTIIMMFNDDDNDVDVVTVVVRSFWSFVMQQIFLAINLLSNHVFMSKTKGKTKIKPKNKKKKRTTDANIGQI